MVLLAAQICEEKKATDTRILELDPADSGFTDFFLITSGSNTRQTGAIADDIELRLKREFGVYARSVEGRRSGEWILLDYFDFVVHIFTEQTREFYDIERLRKSARSLDAAELSAALRLKTEAARKKTPGKKAAKKALPAHAGEDTALTLHRTPSALAKQAPGEKALKKAAKKSSAKKAPAKAAAKKAAKKATGKKAAKKAPAKKSPGGTALARRGGSRIIDAVDTSPRALPGGAPSSTRKQLPPPASDK